MTGKVTEPLSLRMRDTVIYEAHVRGLTANPNSGVAPEIRGTYRGLIEKIPYLVDLGVSAVELLPVHQFDRLAVPEGLVNHWGYQTVSFFAPHAAYSSAPGAAGVRSTSSGTWSRRSTGPASRSSWTWSTTTPPRVAPMARRSAIEGSPTATTTCWTTVAPRTPTTAAAATPSMRATPSSRRLVLDSLRYWVREMHVDGFRFDLAAVLSRDRAGQPIADPPLIWDIDTDPVLAGAKLIAEAWDAGGLYQVGSFAGDRWSEWNGRFRDDLRSFVKSDPGLTASVAQRFLASPDIYGAAARPPQTTINFVTCHDGFTLNDLVTYSAKHNEANGEDGRDGSDDNRSWGCGAEGPTDDPEVEELRARQVRNMLALTLLSMGVPMILMGDEVRRTQGGNNNAYCHDDATAWFDWADLERHADVLAYTKGLIAMRRRFQEALGDPGEMSLTNMLEQVRVQLSGVRNGEPDLRPRLPQPGTHVARPGARRSTSSATRGGSRWTSRSRRCSTASRAGDACSTPPSPDQTGCSATRMHLR